MNRLKELKEKLPKSQKAINELINCIASNKYVIDDNILNQAINGLTKSVRIECEEDIN